MAEIRRCGQCGRPIPDKKSDCPDCTFPTPAPWRISRKALIAASLLLLSLLFFAAGFATRAFHSSEKRLADWPFLPVVHRADFRKLEGIISLEDILGAYRERAGASNSARARGKIPTV